MRIADHRDVLLGPVISEKAYGHCSTRTSTPSWCVRTRTRPRSRLPSRRSSA